MTNSGCMSCEHNLGYKKGCSKGFDKEQNIWWENNGHKKVNENLFDSMDCFQNKVLTAAYDINLSLESLLSDLSEK